MPANVRSFLPAGSRTSISAPSPAVPSSIQTRTTPSDGFGPARKASIPPAAEGASAGRRVFKKRYSPSLVSQFERARSRSAEVMNVT